MAKKTKTNDTPLATLPKILGMGDTLLIDIIESMSVATNHGRDIDCHQVATRKLARLATRMRAAHALLDYTQNVTGSDDALHRIVELFVCETVNDLFNEAARAPSDFCLDSVPKEEAQKEIGLVLTEKNYRAIGRALLNGDAIYTRPIQTDSGDASDEEDLRASTRRFADDVIAPVAEKIHRESMLIPEEIIRQVAELGYFGMSVPEAYDGVGMSNLMMVIATEELSRASLPAGGSLITRPEILAKALLKGGTDEQKKTWLPRIATGDVMVAISVTEPDIGSDVAQIRCRADATTLNGTSGYLINGAKAWCTFAGRADILALLVRTDPDTALGHRGLSLFIVEKDRFTEKEF
ncbi:MAG: acyl-CoA dehydrogenase family protein, partial [Candidatus Hydrogenedentes bacterium]|nr:acyl-CoA dehydrogenase family protein [Candidatus Hydrogenedentota bacterium]